MDERRGIDKVLAPTREERKKVKQIAQNVGYYVIIVLISAVAMILIPFIAGGINGDFSLYFPETKEGWIVFWILRGSVAALNIAFFALFKLQAKQNVRDDPDFLHARELLYKNYKKHVRKPRSPSQMNAEEWLKKGSTIVVTTLIATVTISSLILKFDIMTFLSCLVSTIMGVAFGYVTMRKNEVYWTEEYLEYAKMVDEEDKQVLAEKPQEETKNA